MQVHAERESEVEEPIDKFEDYVDAQWKGMLKMPVVRFADVEDDVANAAYELFRKKALLWLDERADAEGRVFALPLTTLWATAK